MNVFRYRVVYIHYTLGLVFKNFDNTELFCDGKYDAVRFHSGCNIKYEHFMLSRTGIELLWYW